MGEYKTIKVTPEIKEKLRRLKKHPKESFCEVIKRLLKRRWNMFEIYFFLIFIYTLLLLSLKVLKDFASTLAFSFFLIVYSIYCISAYPQHYLLRTASQVNLLLGIYFSIRSSIEIISGGHEEKINLCQVIKKWLKKKKEKK